MAANRRAPEIAYILKGFPRLSETFIANEIYLLERGGLRLRLYSIKRGETAQVQEVVGRIRAPLVTLPEAGSVSGSPLALWLWRHLPLFGRAHARLLWRRPGAYLNALGGALAMAWRYRPTGRRGLRKSLVKEFLQAGAVAAELVDTPSVRHLHGHFCHGAATVTWFVSRLTGLPFSLTAHAKDIYQQTLNPGDLLPRKLRAARFVATCTEANARYLGRLVPDYRRVYRIYHGLDSAAFVPAPAAAGAPPLVLAVGRLVEKKGFIDLIEACAALAAAGLRFRCLIVGEPGDRAVRQHLRRRIRELGLTSAVALQHAVTQDRLKAIYASASAFALPCRVADGGDRDGIPNVLVEAMAMALPVVSTPVSGIPELVTDGVNGLLVPERDGRALAQALRRLLGDSALRARLGSAARATVCRDFDSRRTTETLRSLFVAELRRAGAEPGTAPARQGAPA